MRIDHGNEERAADGCHLVGPGAGELHIVNSDGLSQIDQGIQRGKLRLGWVSGDRVAIILRHRDAAAKARVEADSAIMAHDVVDGFALGQGCISLRRSVPEFVARPLSVRNWAVICQVV